MLNVSVSVRRSPTERAFLQLENVSGDLSVADLKKYILLKAGLDSQCQLELIYSCRPLKDETTLNTLENVDIKMFYATVVKPVEKIQAKKLNAVEQHQLFLAFRAAVTNPNFRQTLQNCAKPENIQTLVETVPGLAEDEIALSMLQDWELLLHLADPKIVQVLVEKHPALVDAASRMMTSVSESLVPGGNQRRRSNSAGWLARSLGADLEDDIMDEDQPQQPSTSQQANRSAQAAINSPGLTPAQLAAALNFAIAQNSIRQPSPSTSTSSQQPQQPSLSPGAPQQQSPRPEQSNSRDISRSSSNNGLTPEMFTSALLQAMTQMGGRPNNSNNTASSVASSDTSNTVTESRRGNDDARLREQFDRFLPQMREYGITDDSLSLRALQATNGDVEAALNLIYAGLVDD
uniref:EOG090X0BNZ n=1 Tax=Daphnia pulicaria TaxID=35523 RepID=A0A4Y7MYI9_9CRUS|nr:EOG090X0BNZ [Daphnia pulicaria]